MFGDWTWIGGRYEPQERDLNGWLGGLVQAKARLAVVELGAGKAIPTVRWRAEGVARAAAASGHQSGGALIRINPDPLAAGVPRGAGVALRAGALAALTAIDWRLRDTTLRSAVEADDTGPA